MARAQLNARQAQLRTTTTTSGHGRLNVNLTTGRIYGAAVMTIGEAEGHGWSIDRVTLEQMRDAIAGAPDGIPVRYKHQGVDTDGNPLPGSREHLGTVVATLSNPRIDGNVLRADLHVGSYAASVPGEGDVRSYLLAMANEAPTKLGLSADFYYSLQNLAGVDVARVVQLNSVDFVERPAANPRGLLAALPESKPMNPKIREMLIAAGMPETATDAEALDFLKNLLASQPAADAAPAQAGTSAATLAERNRIREIFAHAALTNTGDAALALVDSGASAETARAQLNQRLAEQYSPYPVNMRDDAPTIRVGQDRGLAQLSTGAAHALAIRGGVAPRTISPRAEEFVGMPATEIARRMLERVGIDTRGMSRATLAQAMFNPRAALGNQFVRYAQLAATSGDFSNVITTSVNAVLRTGYEENPSTWQMWAKRTTVSNFKIQERPVLSEVPTPELVTEGGEYENVYMSDSKETYRVKKYGSIISLTWEALVNDQLGAFMSLTKKHGQSCTRLEDDLVYAQLTDNAALEADNTALFHTDHSNLMTGTGNVGVPTVALLGAARAKMARQTGPEGSILNIRPFALIVPVTLQTGAEQIVASLVDPSKSNSTENPSFIRNLIVVGEPRLDANSESRWYLAASANSIDTVEVAFLEDQQAPYVEEREGFRTDGTEYKVRHVVAARALDHRGLLRNGA